MNMAESCAVENSLIKKGWEKSEAPEHADLIIINTCSVRKTAENRIWGRLGFYKRLKQSTNFKLIIIGCMAERLKDSIKKDFPVVDSVVSNFKKVRIADLIDDGIETIAAENDTIDESYNFFETHGKISVAHSMIPIMNGCDNYCTYCIVPYVRGHETSRNEDKIIDEIKKQNDSGVSEITLLGQNVNSYRSNNIVFTDLLKRILRETDTKWLRFTSSNPQDFSDELVQLISSEDRICSFVHLPAQHGSDKILRKMNRKYSSDEYLTLASKLKGCSRNISLSTDLMVGFPGETDKDFEALIKLMKAVRFEEAFTYYYNPREGTKAYSFEDDVPHEVKLTRLSSIIDLQQKITKEEKSARLGNITEAVVENFSKKDSNEYLVRTEKNSMAVLPLINAEIGKYVKIKLCDLKGNTFTAEEADV